MDILHAVELVLLVINVQLNSYELGRKITNLPLAATRNAAGAVLYKLVVRLSNVVEVFENV